MTVPEIVVEPDDVARRLREYVRANPGVRKAEYRTDQDPITGACYVLSEAYFHAQGGTDSVLDIFCLSWSDVNEGYDGTHWFLRRNDVVIDLSLPKPVNGETVPWNVATRRAFITGYKPSNRTERVLGALDLEY